jgi:hypothetical protein
MSAQCTQGHRGEKSGAVDEIRRASHSLSVPSVRLLFKTETPFVTFVFFCKAVQGWPAKIQPVLR